MPDVFVADWAAIVLGVGPGSSDGGAAVLDSLMWLAAVVGVAIIATTILAYTRRRMRSSLKDQAPGFTLEDLRSLRDRGRLTSAEYEDLARQMCSCIEYIEAGIACHRACLIR